SVGDLVIGSDGKPTEVLGVYPQGVKEIVEFTLSDGTTVRSTWDHLWTIRRKPGQWRTLTTKDIAAVLDRGGVRGIFLPLVDPVEFAAVGHGLLVYPYTLRGRVGDGGSTDMVSWRPDVESKDWVRLPNGAEFGEPSGNPTTDYNGEWCIRGIL